MRKNIICLMTAMSLGALVFTGCGNSGAQNTGAGQSSTVQTESGNTEINEQDKDSPAAEAVYVETKADEAESTAAGNTGESKEITAEFDPNPQYDKYALVDYYVEDIASEFVATVSAKEDGSEYEVHCSIDGEEQVVTMDKDLHIISDQTGNMAYDAPIVVQNAIDANNWIKID